MRVVILFSMLFCGLAFSACPSEECEQYAKCQQRPTFLASPLAGNAGRMHKMQTSVRRFVWGKSKLWQKLPRPIKAQSMPVHCP